MGKRLVRIKPVILISVLLTGLLSLVLLLFPGIGFTQTLTANLDSNSTQISRVNFSTESFPKAQCISQYGKTACGYSCVANYGDVQCASVPWGNCKAEYGQIVCGPDVTWILNFNISRFPRSRCLSAYGKTACGYNCVADYGDVKCAAFPWGNCKADSGKVTCGPDYTAYQ